MVGVFVGREQELAALAAGLDAATRGRGGLFLIAGEPGIGKSRLADEFAEVAREIGAFVLSGRCWEAGGAPPYWPWVQALRTYIRTTEPTRLEIDLGEGAGHVAQILPDVMVALPDVRLPEVSDPDSARFLLFDATTSFLLRASTSQPIVMILDDLHVADTASLLMLRFAARELHRGRIVVIGAYRDPDPDRDQPLPPELVKLTHEPSTKAIWLSGLAEPDVTRFIDRTTGVVPPASLVSAVWEETEGNPLFVGELVRLLAQEDRLTSMTPGERLAIPDSVREVIERRLGHLSASCRRSLLTASVIGREFGLELLTRIADRPDQEILDHMDEAARARVVGEVPGVTGRFRFAHALIRDTLYDGLPVGDRIELHRRTGEALETLPEEERSARLAELAHHFSFATSGGAAERAIGYAREAAEQAATRLAYEEAGRLYELALRTLKGTAAPANALRCELLVGRGNAQARSGELAEARDTLAAAAELASALGRADDLARAALAYGGGFVWVRAGGDRRLVALLEDALGVLGDRPDPMRVRVLARLACALRDSPDRTRSDALSWLGVEMARQIADPRTLAYALDGRFGAIWWPENPQERLEIADEVVQIGETLRDPEILFHGHHCRLISFLELGEIPRVQVELGRMRALADELRYAYMRWAVAITSANLGSLQGRLADEERFSIEAMEVGSPALLTDAGAHMASHTYRVRREQSRAAEALEPVRNAAETFTWYPFLRCELADLHLELGDDLAARAVYEGLARDGFAPLPRDNEWIFALTLLAPVAVRLDDLDGASTIYGLLLPYGDRHAVGHSEGTTGSVSGALGILATALSRFDDAERHFRDALEHNHRMGAVLWTAYTQLELARMLLVRDRPGDPVQANELLSQALGTARTDGFVRIEGEVQALLPDVAAAPALDERPRAKRPSDVFRREGEYRTVVFNGDGFRLRDSKGVRYLAELLASPGRDIHALDLVAAVEGHRPAPGPAMEGLSVAADDAGPALDERAKVEYRRRLAELETGLDEAEAWNDPERAARLREERDFLARELAAAVGLGGRDRPQASNAERARVNVTRAIRAALDRIAENSPELGRHLTAAVHTGTFCSYRPDPLSPVSWSV